LLVRATFVYGVVLHAHPVRGESHNERNTTGEVVTAENVCPNDGQICSVGDATASAAFPCCTLILSCM